MRRRVWILLALGGLSLSGCLRCLGVECEDECSPSDRQCIGDDTEVCVFDFILTGCWTWFPDQECADYRADCADGRCVCPPGLADCFVCADVATDALHCGGCNQPCGAGTCRDGTCECSEIPTVRRCGGYPVCVDTASDPGHCGDCSVACRASESCIGGTCGCPPGTTWCEAQAVCADLATDPNNCGGCGISCGEGICVDGACIPLRPTGQGRPGPSRSR